MPPIKFDHLTRFSGTHAEQGPPAGEGADLASELAGSIDCDNGLNGDRRAQYLELARDNHKEGAALSPCSKSTSPRFVVRVRPCGVIRRFCVGVNFGNICSMRALANGRPLRVLFIVTVVPRMVAHRKSPLGTFRNCP